MYRSVTVKLPKRSQSRKMYRRSVTHTTLFGGPKAIPNTPAPL